jgi:hypothetical protein
MKNNKMFLAGMLILPWLSLPLLGKKTVKRFLPSSLFICFFVLAESFLSRKRVWWWFYKKLHPKLIGEIPLIWGPFFIGSLWIMKVTYGKLFTYLASNFIVDTFFVYKVTGWFKQNGYASLVRLKKYQLSLIFLLKSVLMYVFQYVFEKVMGLEKKYENQGS